MKWFVNSKVRLLLPGCIVCLMAAYALGQTENNNADSGITSAAGPRLGTVVVVEVTLPNCDALDELIRAGYDISGVRGNVATIYATEEELERLEQTGYPLREIERQPKPSGFDIMALGGYHSYAALTDELNIYAEAYPDICRLYTLGQSVQGRELWAMLISDNPDDEEDEPEFKYVSTIHGDEPVGTEMCLYFIDLLLTEYGTDERITNLIDGTAIWTVALMNPDGLERSTRANANGYDLNRNFPTVNYSSMNIYEGAPLVAETCQPEVRHIINWTAENSFVLSATLHTGALVVRYPYDNDGKGRVDSPTPDDLLFEEISRRYSMWNLPMWNSTSYPQGIVNGAFMYPVNGGAIDWHYRYLSCNEVAIELSNVKRPSAYQIPNLWSDNKESMLSYLEAVHIGLRGIITDRASGEPLSAQVLVEGNTHPVFTDPDVGDYHRMLLPGAYDLIFHAYGYVPFTVRNITVPDGHAVRLDVELIPQQASPDFNWDSIVDFKDFSMLGQYWYHDRSPFGDYRADYEYLAVLADYWLKDIPEFGLVAHWKLDETQGMLAYDSAGDKDGSLNGDPIWEPTGGKVNGAVQLDGTGDYVSTPFVLNPGDGKFSVFAWTKGGEPGQVIIGQANGANWLAIDSSEGWLITDLKGTGRFGGSLWSHTVITDDNWHRVGLTWDGSTRILYVDDVEVAKDTQAGLVGSQGGLYIGGGNTLDAGSFWAGLIDDVRIYDRAVTP